MAEFLETSDFSYTFAESISAVTTYNFSGKMVRQFILNVDADVLITWTNNIGVPYPVKAGETVAVPCRISSMTITPSAATNVRLIGIG